MNPDHASADYQDGYIGPMPDWARAMLAARWMKVAPWDLMAQEEPDFWIEGASVLSNAEHEAATNKSK